MYGFIYITTNNINGKQYVGKCTINNSYYEDYLGSGQILNRAILKYGRENFSREILTFCDTSEILDFFEKYWIEKLNCCKSRNFYNIAAGGTGGNVFAGYTLEEKIRYSQKISKDRKGENNPFFNKKHKEETKEKLRKTFSGKKLTQEHKQNVSNSLLGEKNPMYGKYGENNPNFGKKRTEKQKDFMSKKMKEASFKRLVEKAKIENKKVLMINKETLEQQEFLSLSICSHITGLRRDCIKNVLNGTWKQYKNFYFKYI